jgi:hypothetical protein
LKIKVTEPVAELVHAPLYLQVSNLSLIFILAHTDPSLDFFEVAYPVKYKKKYAHYLNQRIFYDIKQVEQD